MDIAQKNMVIFRTIQWGIEISASHVWISTLSKLGIKKRYEGVVGVTAAS